jgi:hypothetical protein
MTPLPIDLPEGFTLLVVEGEKVDIGQIIARKDAPKDVSVNIIRALNISHSHAKKALQKIPGEQINPGDVIAIKKNFFGKVKSKITSQTTGTITRYDEDTGDLVVRTDVETSSLELISPVAGTVALCNNREIVIDTNEAFVSGGVALGHTGEGILYILKESFDEGLDNTLYYLDNRAADKIVSVKELTRDLIIKGESIGVKGFIGSNISKEDISYLEKKDITIPVLEIAAELVSQLNSWENRKIMIEVKSKAIILRD